MTDAPMTPPRAGGRMKFLIGGLLIVAAVVYLIASSSTRRGPVLPDRR